MFGARVPNSELIVKIAEQDRQCAERVALHDRRKAAVEQTGLEIIPVLRNCGLCISTDTGRY